MTEQNIEQLSYQSAPEATDNRKTRFTVAAVIANLVMVTIAVGLWLHYSKDMVDTKAVEASISSEYLLQRQVIVEVNCPKDIEAKAGAIFHCIASYEGDKVLAEVTVENTEGAFTWRVN